MTDTDRRTARPDSPVVLVVEDDPTLRSTLAWNLGREGYEVLMAADGAQGLEIANRELDAINLILLDVMMPKLNGFQVLRQIRARSQVPVLMLTARGDEQDRIDGLELGADDYIVKPFVMRELLARVRAGMRRSAILATQPSMMVHRGDLAIELDRQRVTAGGRELLLRPKEYGLLVALAMEPGRIFNRTELLDEVWGTDVIVDERTVDVHISWLRGKLADAGLGSGVIRTAYGRGYRFSLPGDAGGELVDEINPTGWM